MTVPRVRRFELAAVSGVWRRQWALYRRYWTTTTFASVVEPTLYLLAFGFGFGSLVGAVAGYRYLDFVGTGVVATAVLFISTFAGMFTTYIQRTHQHTYDAMLAAPVDTHELVTSEATWIAAKAGVYGCAPLLVAILFGLPPRASMLLVPMIAFLAGLGFALFGITISAIVPSINSFDYVISGVITPLFLVAGTFFPLAALPPWASVLAQFNPLHHCVELVRHAAFGLRPLTDLVHLGVLLLFAGVMWVLAVRLMRRRLID